jgi:hypothetical protein
MKGYPRGFRSLLLWALLGVVLSGLLLVPALLQLRAEMDVAWQLPAGSRVGVAALHAGAGSLLLGLTGALWTVHMRAGWHRHRRRTSGGMLAASLLLLAVSALGVYYFGDEMLAAAAAYLHLAAGLTLAAVFAWHWRAARISAG